MYLKLLALAAVLLPASFAARADGLGTSVTGSLTFNGGTINYFDPANGFVPAGFGNTAGTTVVIGPGVEFGFMDGVNKDTADFTGTTLTVSDVDTVNASPFEMDFTDPAFLAFSQLTNASGYTYSFSGDTLRVFYAGTFTPGTYTTTFSYATVGATVTPEPSSLILLFTGVLAFAWFGRERIAETMAAAGNVSRS